MRRMVCKAPGILVLVAALAAGWAMGVRAQSAGAGMEGQVRAAAFRYYAGTVLGDFATYQSATRFPLAVVRAGTLTTRDEKQAREMVERIAERNKAANLSDADRRTIGANMLRLFDGASVQFVGADTAAVTFTIRPATKERPGDVLGHLLLHRRDGAWRVIFEVTDPAPVPPSYVEAVRPAPEGAKSP
ncbi:MAG: hypothetical protein IT208_11085 [Chthonomonadales bacterium]|nr:hypothetical protein [Chthonomonadales bacterium]